LGFVKGMAHITGGGLLGNLPRTLPPGLAACFDMGSWPVHPIFSLIQRRGGVSAEEMYQVFNMGVGMVVFCSPDNTGELGRQVPEAKVIGEVVEQKDDDRVIIL